MFIRKVINLEQCKDRYFTPCTPTLLEEICEYCNRVFSRYMDVSVAMANILQNYCHQNAHGSDIMMVLLNDINYSLSLISKQQFCSYLTLSSYGNAVVMQCQLSTKVAV